MPRFLILIIVLLLFSSLFLAACQDYCANSKEDFLSNYQNFINDIKSNKRKRNDSDWVQLDNRFRIFMKECQPRYAKQMTTAESYRFWQQAIGYMYARYGLELLKKFKDTDDLILKLRNGLQTQNIDIPLAVDSLCREWPILVGAGGSSLGFRLEKILLRNPQDTLLPAWKE